MRGSFEIVLDNDGWCPYISQLSVWVIENVFEILIQETSTYVFFHQGKYGCHLVSQGLHGYGYKGHFSGKSDYHKHENIYETAIVWMKII